MTLNVLLNAKNCLHDLSLNFIEQKRKKNCSKVFRFKDLGTQKDLSVIKFSEPLRNKLSKLK